MKYTITFIVLAGVVGGLISLSGIDLNTACFLSFFQGIILGCVGVTLDAASYT